MDLSGHIRNMIKYVLMTKMNCNKMEKATETSTEASN